MSRIWDIEPSLLCTKHLAADEAFNNCLHLLGLDEQDAETLCGHSWSGIKHEIIEGSKPTCKGCISIAKELFINRGYSKKEVKSW